MAQRGIIESMLPEDQLEAYEAWLRECRPVPTMDDRVAWLKHHGFKFSRKAAWTHSKSFEERLIRFKESAEFSRAAGEAVNDGGGDIAQGNVIALQHLLQKALYEADNEMDPGELMKLSVAVRGAVAAGRGAVALRDEIAELKKKMKTAVEEASKAATKDGGSAAAVVDAVKRALGIGGGGA